MAEDLAVDIGGAEHAVEVLARELWWALMRLAPEAWVEVGIIGGAAGEPALSVGFSDELPEVGGGCEAEFAADEPFRVGEAEVEADDHARGLAREFDEPWGDLVSGATGFKADGAGERLLCLCG